MEGRREAQMSDTTLRLIMVGLLLFWVGSVWFVERILSDDA